MLADYEHDWLLRSLASNRYVYALHDKISTAICNQYDTWTKSKLRDNFNLAVNRLCSQLGDNIYVALSGGIDSQVACLSLRQNNINFTAGIMVFANEFNSMDYEHAILFCIKNNIPYVTVTIDLINFLVNSLSSYVDLYQCPSPQISTHFYFYNKLRELYHPSAIICGGTNIRLVNGSWAYGLSRSQTAWTTYKRYHNFPLVGDFLSSSWDINLLLMMTSLNIETADVTEDNQVHYSSKVLGMKQAGFDIIPQDKKYTGFENLKKYLNDQSRKTRVFDHRFRVPNEARVPEYKGSLKLDDLTTNCLNLAYKQINIDN
jgi:hypothetical protein